MITKIYDRFGETLHILKLKNGMQVHILPKKQPYYTTYVELSIPYGALNLEFKQGEHRYQSPPGTAHFLEHKIFAMPDGDAFAKFSQLGVDANAMTSSSQTSYLFSATNHVMESLEHLLDMLDTPYFTDENVESEKSIINEELKMYLDDPNVVMQNELLEMMYHHHPIKHDIGGSIETVSNVTKETLFDAYNQFYLPNNRLLTIAGKVDLKALKAFFRAYDLNHQTPRHKPKTMMPKEPVHLVCKSRSVKKDIGLNKLMFGIKLSPTKGSDKEKVKQELALTMAMNMRFGPSSTIYEDLLSKQLINQNFYINPTFENQAEMILIYAESKKIYPLKKLLTSYLIQEQVDDISEEGFIRFKKVFIGQYVIALDHLEVKTYLYSKFHHQHISLFEVIDILNDLTFEDVKHALRRIKKKHIATLIYKKA